MKWVSIDGIDDINEFNNIDAIKASSLNGDIYQLVREGSDFVNNTVNFPINWIYKENKIFLIQDPYCKDCLLIIKQYIRKLD